jgi:hypothetical protein
MAWAPDYAEVEELRAFVRIVDEDDDAQLQAAVTAASRAIDDHCKRQFGTVDTAQARQYTARWSRSRGGWLVPIDDLATTDGVVVALDLDGDGVHELTLTAADYVLRPHNAVQKGQVWTELLIRPSTSLRALDGAAGAVQGLAPWGWPAVPATVHEASLLQASRLVQRRDAPFGVAGSPETGSEVRLLARVDPDVAVTLGPYRRRVWAR